MTQTTRLPGAATSTSQATSDVAAEPAACAVSALPGRASGELVDLAIVNASRLAIFRLLEKLLRDPFDMAATEKLAEAQSNLGASVHTAELRLLAPPATS